MRFDGADIGAVDHAVDGDVGAEVGDARGLAGIRFRLADIGGVDGTVGGGVAEEDGHRDRDVARVGAIAHAREREGERLRVGDVVEVYRHNLIGHDGRVSGRPAVAARDAGPSDRNRKRKGDDDGVIAIGPAAAAFDPRVARERQFNIEVTGGPVCLSRNNTRRYRRRECRVLFRKRLITGARGVVADGPALERRDAPHGIDEVELRAAGVGGGDDGPRIPVPALDQSLIAGVSVNVVTDCPAVGRRGASDAMEGVGLRAVAVGRADDGPSVPVPALDQGLIVAVSIDVVADGPAIGRRDASDAKEGVGLRSAGVGRGEDGPRVPVPSLYQGLKGGAGVGVDIADGPATGRRRARHAIKEVGLRSAGVGRGDDSPRAPVPAFDQGLSVEAIVAGVARGPAVGRRHARHAVEEVVARGAGVGRGDDGPRVPVPACDHGLKGGGDGAVDGVADGPALGRRHARYAIQKVLIEENVGGGDDGPRRSVPVLDQGLSDDADFGVADDPTIGRRHARDT